jgi:hypothetical protein
VRTVGSGSSRLRAALGVLCALPFLVAVPSVAGGSGAPDLGTPPPDCGAVHRDYADPSCTTQTRNGTFSLSAHVVHTGGTLTGTIGARCMHHNGIGFDQPPNELCPIDWNGMLALGKRKSGCTPAAGFCTVKIPKRAAQTKYTIRRRLHGRDARVHDRRRRPLRRARSQRRQHRRLLPADRPPANPPLEPDRWLVTFALKGYPKACSDGTTYTWSIAPEKSGHVMRGAGCRFQAKLDSQGKFKATLKVSSEGEAAVSSDKDLEDILIVSLGDSFGSGEGVPEPTGSAYAWESDRCHTSSQSGFALAARNRPRGEGRRRRASTLLPPRGVPPPRLLGRSRRAGNHPVLRGDRARHCDDRAGAAAHADRAEAREAGRRHQRHHSLGRR